MKPQRKKKEFSSLGKAIEQCQNDSGISTYRIAKLTGLTEGTMSKIKHGITNPSIDTLERVAKVLGVTASVILYRKEIIDSK